MRLLTEELRPGQPLLGSGSESLLPPGTAWRGFWRKRTPQLKAVPEAHEPEGQRGRDRERAGERWAEGPYTEPCGLIPETLSMKHLPPQTHVSRVRDTMRKITI